MRASKVRHAWTLHLEGAARETVVELEHSKLTGKKVVLLDGDVVFSTRERSLRWSWEHPASQSRICLDSDSGQHWLECKGPGQDFECGAGGLRSLADVREDSVDGRLVHSGGAG